MKTLSILTLALCLSALVACTSDSDGDSDCVLAPNGIDLICDNNTVEQTRGLNTQETEGMIGQELGEPLFEDLPLLMLPSPGELNESYAIHATDRLRVAVFDIDEDHFPISGENALEFEGDDREWHALEDLELPTIRNHTYLVLVLLVDDLGEQTVGVGGGFFQADDETPRALDILVSVWAVNLDSVRIDHIFF